jgi:hypothetical protein
MIIFKFPSLFLGLNSCNDRKIKQTIKKEVIHHCVKSLHYYYASVSYL